MRRTKQQQSLQKSQDAVLLQNMIASHHTFSLEEKEESKTSHQNSGEMPSEIQVV